MTERIPQVWRVDVLGQTLEREPVPAPWQRLGGRGLLARILLDEVDARCEPLGPHNKLIFAPGLLVGHTLSSTDRISIGAKSPLTRGIKEANAGGRTGLDMTHLGIHALIIEGQPSAPGLWILHLSMGGAKWEKADHLRGLGVYATAKALVETYGEKVAISLIGPAAEMKMKAAGIENLDKDRVPSRMAARGGLGAVMASKGLKAIVIDKTGGQRPSLANPDAFKLAQKDYTKSVLEHPQSILYRDFGTAAMAHMSDGFGGLPTHNFSMGHFDKVEEISGETMRDFLLTRGKPSETSHACMVGCTIKCSNIFGGEDGKMIVSPLEYETIGLMGSNLGISSLDAIARMNWEVNDMGLDSIDVGAALGVAAEAKLMQWGDCQAAMSLIGEIRKGSEIGRALGDGAAAAGEKLGIERVPVVKRQAMSAYEPRAIKGTGVTYATSPQGADHTAGLTIRFKINHLDPTVQKEASLTAQLNMAGYDSLGICIFAASGYTTAPNAVIKRLLQARYGWNDLAEGIVQDLGKQTIKMEREFNRRAGFAAEDDRLPAWMTTEPLSPHNSVFDVAEGALDSIFDELE